MSMKRLAINAAIGSTYNGQYNSSSSYYSNLEKSGHYQGLQTMRPGASLHGNVNVLLGGAMLSVVITVVCFVCYCCHRTIKKRSNTMTYRHQHRWMDTDPNMEIYSVEQCYETSGLFIDNPHHQQSDSIVPPNHGPPPSYEAVVANDELYARSLICRKYSQHNPGEMDELMMERRRSTGHHYCPFMVPNQQLHPPCFMATSATSTTTGIQVVEDEQREGEVNFGQLAKDSSGDAAAVMGGDGNGDSGELNGNRSRRRISLDDNNGVDHQMILSPKHMVRERGEEEAETALIMSQLCQCQQLRDMTSDSCHCCFESERQRTHYSNIRRRAHSSVSSDGHLDRNRNCVNRSGCTAMDNHQTITNIPSSSDPNNNHVTTNTNDHNNNNNSFNIISDSNHFNTNSSLTFTESPYSSSANYTETDNVNNNNINHHVSNSSATPLVTASSSLHPHRAGETTTTPSGAVDLDPLHDNGVIRMDMSKIIDRTGLPTYEAALRLESSGYV